MSEIETVDETMKKSGFLFSKDYKTTVRHDIRLRSHVSLRRHTITAESLWYLGGGAEHSSILYLTDEPYTNGIVKFFNGTL